MLRPAVLDTRGARCDNDKAPGGCDTGSGHGDTHPRCGGGTRSRGRRMHVRPGRLLGDIRTDTVRPHASTAGPSSSTTQPVTESSLPPPTRDHNGARDLFTGTAGEHVSTGATSGVGWGIGFPLLAGRSHSRMVGGSGVPAGLAPIPSSSVLPASTSVTARTTMEPSTPPSHGLRSGAIDLVDIG